MDLKQKEPVMRRVFFGSYGHLDWRHGQAHGCGFLLECGHYVARKALPEIIPSAVSCAECSNLGADSIELFMIENGLWSEKTFGGGTRTSSIVEHIRRELEEILARPDDLEEWIDVIILALEGFRRAGGWPERLLPMLYEKLEKNKKRRWLKPAHEDLPVEHDRSEE